MEDIEVEGYLHFVRQRTTKNGKTFQVWKAGDQEFTVFDGRERELLKHENCYAKIVLVNDGKFKRFEGGALTIKELPPLSKIQLGAVAPQVLKPSLSEDAACYRDCLQTAQKILKDFYPLQQPTVSDTLSVTRDLFIYRKQK